MKKLLAFLLCLTAVFGLTACGGEGGNSFLKGEPSEEDLVAIGYYENAVTQLDQYMETGNLVFTYANFGIESETESVSGQNALAAYYELLTNLDAVDKWVGTEHITNTDINWDRQAVLDSFAVVEDVLIGIVPKRNYSDGEVYGNELLGLIQYDKDGKVIMFDESLYLQELCAENIYPERYHKSCYYWIPEYNEENKLIQLTGYNVSYGADKREDEVVATRTFTYDASGKQIQEKLKNEHWEIDFLFTYDQNNHLTQISWSEGEGKENLTIDYTYDDAGKLIQTVETAPVSDSKGTILCLLETTSTFSYDADGRLTEETVTVVDMIQGENGMPSHLYPGLATNSIRTNKYSYTYNAQGKIDTKTITYGDVSYYFGEDAGQVKPASLSVTESVYVYDNYYIYSPAE